MYNNAEGSKLATGKKRARKFASKTQPFKRDELWNVVYSTFMTDFEDISTMLNDHGGMKGTFNEKLLKRFLKAFLPNRYRISQNKKLLDLAGNASPQQDLVIWDAMKVPRVFPHRPFLLIECASACVEVKTELNKKTLGDALNNVVKIRHLEMIEKSRNPLGAYPPLNIIFAYRCQWKNLVRFSEALENEIKERNIQPRDRFDYLYIAQKGLLIDWTEDPTATNLEKSTLPSQLREGTPLISTEYRPLWLRYQQANSFLNKNEFFNMDLDINDQIMGIVDFLATLNDRLEKNTKLDSSEIIRRSFPKGIQGYLEFSRDPLL